MQNDQEKSKSKDQYSKAKSSESGAGNKIIYAPSGYILFCQDYQAQRKQSKITLVELCNQWKQLSEREKSKWNEKSNEIKLALFSKQNQEPEKRGDINAAGINSKLKKNKKKDKFLHLKRDLRLYIISFLPIEDNFESLIAYDEKIATDVKKMKIYSFLSSGIVLRTLRSGEFTKEFLKQTIKNWKNHFETEEERDEFVKRILNKIYSNNLNNYCFEYYRDSYPSGLDGVVIKFLLESKHIESVSFAQMDAEKKEDLESLENFASIFGNPRIAQIDFFRSFIRDQGAEVLGRVIKTNASVQILNLRYNKIGNEGAKAIGEALKTNCFLSYLNLEDNEIKDEGVKVIGEGLKSNASLKQLNLRENSIGFEGGIGIARGLESNSSLEYIYLLYNHIGNKGAAAFRSALRLNTTLKKIDLNYNQISGKFRKVLIEEFKGRMSVAY